eukprot:7149839-Prymnesium_polylepis.2
MYTLSVNGWPLSVTLPYALPPLGCRIRVLSSVVLPAPDGPMRASTSPAGTRAEQSRMRSLGPVFVLTTYAHLTNSSVAPGSSANSSDLSRATFSGAAGATFRVEFRAEAPAGVDCEARSTPAPGEDLGSA